MDWSCSKGYRQRRSYQRKIEKGAAGLWSCGMACVHTRSSACLMHQLVSNNKVGNGCVTFFRLLHDRRVTIALRMLIIMHLLNAEARSRFGLTCTRKLDFHLDKQLSALLFQSSTQQAAHDSVAKGCLPRGPLAAAPLAKTWLPAVAQTNLGLR